MHSHADRLFKVWQYWRFRWRASGSANAKHIQLCRPGTKRFPKSGPVVPQAATLGCCWSRSGKQNWEVGKSERNFAAWVICVVFVSPENKYFSWKWPLKLKKITICRQTQEILQSEHQKNTKSHRNGREVLEAGGHAAADIVVRHTLWLWLTVCHGSHGP